MTPHFTIREMPVGSSFRLRGGNVSLTKTAEKEISVTDGTSFIDPLEWALLVRATPDSETDELRPMFKIDPLAVIMSFGNVYLMKTPDGFIIETFDSQGRVHFEQYFAPQNLHRAISKMQSLMPDEIPEDAMTDITRPCGAQQYSTSLVESCITDTFFIGYGERLNSVERMRAMLEADGWAFNDLTQEQTL